LRIVEGYIFYLSTGTPDNFRKETLIFEVVGFRGAYYAILGRPCYAKFMALPNYTYLKMKMPVPKGVVTVGSSIEHAFNCDVECIEHTEALEKLANEGPDSSAKHAGSLRLPSKRRRWSSTLPPPRAKR
jgi:hypothetical protein